MNQRTQYSIIGGGIGAFIIILVLIFLPQADDIPITPVGEQIISNQTDDSEIDDSGDDLEDLPVPLEEIAIEDDIMVITIPESTSSNVRSFRSGGGGGGGGSDGDGDSDSNDFFYQLKLIEGDQESDGTIDLGQNIKAVASTDDDRVDEVTFRWIDPTSNIVKTEIVSIALGSSSHQPDQLGTWIVEADFGNGEIVIETLEISFLVIPESPIGTAALMASSLAAFGGYILLRRKSSNNRTKAWRTKFPNPHFLPSRIRGSLVSSSRLMSEFFKNIYNER